MFLAGWPSFSAKAQKCKTPWAFAFIPLLQYYELRLRQFSEFLEVLWDSDANFSSYKAVIWQLYVVYAYFPDMHLIQILSCYMVLLPPKNLAV